MPTVILNKDKLRPTDKEQRQFWSKVEKDTPADDGCWEYRNGEQDQEDQIFHEFRGDKVKANHFAWMLSKRDLKSGESLRQKCKNPLCVMEEHQKVIHESVKSVGSNDKRHDKVTRPPVLRKLPDLPPMKEVLKRKPGRPPGSPNRAKVQLEKKTIAAYVETLPEIIKTQPAVAQDSSIETMALKKWLAEAEKKIQEQVPVHYNFPRAELYWWERNV